MQIRHDVPPPPDRPRLSWPFDILGIGGYFDAPPDTTLRARLAAASYKRNHPGWRYISRTLLNGSVRFWRLS